MLLACGLALSLAASLWPRPGPPTPLAAPAGASGATGAPPGDEAAAKPAPIRRVEEWALAWSEQRVEDYLAAYSPSFTPPRGLDRAAWERQRRSRILAPRWIRVDLALLELDEVGAHRCRVRFVQAYDSDTYRDLVRKVLDLQREADGWKILREAVER